jgi:hypothetical protein
MVSCRGCQHGLRSAESPLLVLESASAATDLDLISYLRSNPDARMRRGVRFPAWYLLLVAVLGILSGCQSLRDLERFAILHHAVLTEALGVELRRPPSDSSFRYFFQQVDVPALCTAIRDWTIAQIPCGATDLDQLVCDGKTLRGSIVPTAGGDSAFIAQVTLYSAALGVAISQVCYATGETHERAMLRQLLGELDLEGVLIQADALQSGTSILGSGSQEALRPRHHLDAAPQTGSRAHQRCLDRHQLDRGRHGQRHP